MQDAGESRGGVVATSEPPYRRTKMLVSSISSTRPVMAV